MRKIARTSVLRSDVTSKSFIRMVRHLHGVMGWGICLNDALPRLTDFFYDCLGQESVLSVAVLRNVSVLMGRYGVLVSRLFSSCMVFMTDLLDAMFSRVTFIQTSFTRGCRRERYCCCFSFQPSGSFNCSMREFKEYYHNWNVSFTRW